MDLPSLICHLPTLVFLRKALNLRLLVVNSRIVYFLGHFILRCIAMNSFRDSVAFIL